jgi:hydroxypyruvate reductase
LQPQILGDSITGEARAVGREMAALARRTRGPAALISGGECTVTIQGEGGRGGRCSEFLLSLGIEYPQIWAIAADTDGIDGSEDNAGAVWSPDLAARPGAREALQRHDSYGFFKDAGTLVVTGATRTNVNDYRAILVP